jgi:zinc D-Ala-D-Ala carboxypeptidase
VKNVRLKLIVLFVTILLGVSGCNQINSPFKKLPFTSNNSGKENKQIQEEIPPENDPLSLESIFFNEIKEVDGKNVIQNSTNTMALVNKQYFLPENYVPEDLVRPNVAFSFGGEAVEKSLMRQEAADALTKMFTEAKNAGIELFAVSGYRSFNRQQILFEAESNRVGKEKAMQVVAIPGSSEHQSGLAMDITSRSINFNLDESYADTNEGKWLAENAHHFGFILRYPKGKESITNYIYEPWHFRYVGVKAAKVIYEQNWTLEEYFTNAKKI